jgi:hypothetical protein
MARSRGRAVALLRGALAGYALVALLGIAVEMWIGLLWGAAGFGSFDISIGPVLLLGITRLPGGGEEVPFEGPVVVAIAGAVVGLVLAIRRERDGARSRIGPGDAKSKSRP